MNARFLALTTRIVVGILWLLVPHLALPQKTFSHLTTLAGNGIAAYSGDGGLAISAALNAPNAR